MDAVTVNACLHSLQLTQGIQWSEGNQLESHVVGLPQRQLFKHCASGHRISDIAILGLLGLSGILMRNTLILMGQIDTNRHNGLDIYHSVVEATVQRARPVILTAVAAVLAFIPLTQSVFRGPLVYTLIGGTAAGTALILLFLPALYAIWYRVKPVSDEQANSPAIPREPVSAVPGLELSGGAA